MKEELSARKRHIALTAAYTAVGDIQRLTAELHASLDDGLSISELREVMMHCYAYAGFPRALNALTAMVAVLKDRKGSGIEDEEGQPAKELEEGADRDVVGEQIREELTGSRSTPAYAAFAPDIDGFLKQHLFCDLFTRGVLSREERELVTISVLVTEKGAEQQLVTHFAICQRQGFTQGETTVWTELMEKTLETPPLFGLGTPNVANAAYFSGQSFVNPMLEEPMRITNVVFEPGCINNWHIHHKGGQILLVTEGHGWYQEWEQPPVDLKPGDVVNIPAETKHWHGAAAGSRFVHVAISVPAQGASTEWLETAHAPESGDDN